jgi:hypothetical protein
VVCDINITAAKRPTAHRKLAQAKKEIAGKGVHKSTYTKDWHVAFVSLIGGSLFGHSAAMSVDMGIAMPSTVENASSSPIPRLWPHHDSPP